MTTHVISFVCTRRGPGRSGYNILNFKNIPSVSVSSLAVVTKCLTKQGKKGGLVWGRSLRYSRAWWGSHGGGIVRWLVTWYPRSGEQRDNSVQLALPFPFLQALSSQVVPTYRLGGSSHLSPSEAPRPACVSSDNSRSCQVDSQYQPPPFPWQPCVGVVSEVRQPVFRSPPCSALPGLWHGCVYHAATSL